jgi:hypothetical protein
MRDLAFLIIVVMPLVVIIYLLVLDSIEDRVK